MSWEPCSNFPVQLSKHLPALQADVRSAEQNSTAWFRVSDPDFHLLVGSAISRDDFGLVPPKE